MKDQDLMRQLEDRTLEPRQQFSTPAFTSSQWATSEAVDYLSKRQFNFQKNTGIVASHYGFSGDANTAIAVSANQEAVQLTEGTVDVLRAAFIQGGAVNELPRESAWTLDRDLALSWETSQASFGVAAYDEDITPVPSVYLASPPASSGALDVILVETPAEFTNAGVAISVPDDLSPYIVWGALADMLGKSGEGHDRLRAQYAAQRWEEGVVLGRMLIKRFLGSW